MTNGDDLPPGFTPGWPPADAEAFFEDIKRKWDARPGHSRGKHWALQLYGDNPISGYRIVIKQCGPNDP